MEQAVVGHQTIECAGCNARLRVPHSARVLRFQCPVCCNHLELDAPEPEPELTHPGLLSAVDRTAQAQAMSAFPNGSSWQEIRTCVFQMLLPSMAFTIVVLLLRWCIEPGQGQLGSWNTLRGPSRFSFSEYAAMAICMSSPTFWTAYSIERSGRFRKAFEKAVVVSILCTTVVSVFAVLLTFFPYPLRVDSDLPQRVQMEWLTVIGMLGFMNAVFQVPIWRFCFTRMSTGQLLIFSIPASILIPLIAFGIVALLDQKSVFFSELISPFRFEILFSCLSAHLHAVCAAVMLAPRKPELD
jgi:hypothetical protein